VIKHYCDRCGAEGDPDKGSTANVPLPYGWTSGQFKVSDNPKLNDANAVICLDCKVSLADTNTMIATIKRAMMLDWWKAGQKS